MSLTDHLDAVLPQTQCEQCGYAGCYPYAEAMAHRGETPDRCPPGGHETATALAALLQHPLQLPRQSRPLPQIAFIREAGCIGCTKCIQACPVDAICGAARLMHTIIRDECTGCGLCIPPCPVDCIEWRPLSANEIPLLGDIPLNATDAARRQQRRELARHRYQQRRQRLQHMQTALSVSRSPVQKPTITSESAQALVTRLQNHRATPPSSQREVTRKKAAQIRMALNRAEKQLRQHGTPTLQQQVQQLRVTLHNLEA